MRRHLVVLCSFVVAIPAWAASPSDGVDKIAGQTVLRLSGADREMGKAQGELLKDRVAATVKSLVNDWAPSQGVSVDELKARRDAQKPLWPQSFKDELAGLAEGSGVSLDELELAQVVPVPPLGVELAAFGPASIGGKMIHLFRLETPKDRPAPPPVVVIRRPTVGLANVALAPAGYLGVLAGMNERGVSVSAVAAPLAKPAGHGVAAPVAIREALRTADSLSAFEPTLSKTPIAGGWNLLVTDGKIPDARVLEIAGDKATTFGANDSGEKKAPFSTLVGAIRRSAAFADSSLAGLQPPNESGAAGTLLTQAMDLYKSVGKALEGRKQALTIAETIRLARTVDASRTAPAAVIFSPSDLDFWVATGGAERADFARHNLLALTGDHAETAPSIDSIDKPLDPAKERLVVGKVAPKERANDPGIPEGYRLGTDPFEYELEPEKVVQGIVRAKLRFTSPVKTPYPENNVVHMEYFRPFGRGPFPCVMVLHIAGGDFELSRFVANAISQRGVACVFMKMPYYGERQPPGKKVRMLEPDIAIASQAMQQMVQDSRRLCDWMEARPEFLPGRYGVIGVSLGSITGALACAIEPRFTHGCFIMGGAKLHEVIFESVEGEAREYKKLWLANGGTREALAEVIAPFDPYTYRDRLKERTVLMISATQDESIPKVSGLALWEAAGKQEIVWYECGHYTMIRYIMPALNRAVKFYKDWPPRYAKTAPKG